MNYRKETVTVLQVNLSSEQQTREGSSFWKASLRLPDGWRNTTVWSAAEAKTLENLEPGDELEVILYEEQFNGREYLKFKFPNAESGTSLRARIADLEQGFVDLQKQMDEAFKKIELINNPLDAR